MPVAPGWRASHCTTSISDHVRAAYRSPVGLSTTAWRGVELRELDEPLRPDARRRRGHRAAVELVEPGGGDPSRSEPEPEPVPRAPRRRAQEQVVRLGRHVPPDELAVGLEPAGREDDRRSVRQLPERLAEPQLAAVPDERRRQGVRVEADADRGGVARLPAHHRRAELLQPPQVDVEPLVHEALEHGVAAGALAAEVVELAVPPDDPAREQHRAARAVALLEDEHARATGGRLRRGDEPGHSGPGDDEVGHGRLRRARSPACARRTRA